MELKLKPIQANLTAVTIDTLTVWFSYETAVAFETPRGLVVSENRWGTTTGKHLSVIDGGTKDAKSNRVMMPYVFNDALALELAKLGGE